MKPLMLGALFGAAFAAAAVATFPMSVALSWAGARKMGLSATSVSGSVWNARLVAAAYRGIPLGDVEFSLNASALTSGTPRWDVKGAPGTAVLVLGSSRGFEAADVTIDVQRLQRALPFAGRLRLEQATILFSNDACARADGRVATDILKRTFNGPELSGTLSCAGDAAVAQLEGRSQDLEARVVLRLDNRGKYQARTRIVSANPLVRRALAVAGFTEDGSGFVRSDDGAVGT